MPHIEIQEKAHALFDDMVQWATQPSKTEDVVEAKAQYLLLSGEVSSEDPQFEMRMASFLEYYLCDRARMPENLTPAQLFSQTAKGTKNDDMVRMAEALSHTRHSLFKVKKLGKGFLRVKDMFSEDDIDVFERRRWPGLEKGDLFEARIFEWSEQHFFTEAFGFHPKGVRGQIEKELKTRKKNGQLGRASEFCWDLARRAVRAERYKQVATEKIYDFQNSPW